MKNAIEATLAFLPKQIVLWWKLLAYLKDIRQQFLGHHWELYSNPPHKLWKNSKHTSGKIESIHSLWLWGLSIPFYCCSVIGKKRTLSVVLDLLKAFFDIRVKILIEIFYPGTMEEKPAAKIEKSEKQKLKKLSRWLTHYRVSLLGDLSR